MRKALLPTGKTEVWTDLINDLIGQRKLKLKPLCNVYNPDINKSFE